jgi:hypothetical protein
VKVQKCLKGTTHGISKILQIIEQMFGEFIVALFYQQKNHAISRRAYASSSESVSIEIYIDTKNEELKMKLVDSMDWQVELPIAFPVCFCAIARNSDDRVMIL